MKQIGDFRKRVTWKTPPANDGWTTGAWTTQGTYWAAIEPLTGNEPVIGNAQLGVLTHQVTMRAVGNLKPEDQLIYTRYLPDGSTVDVTLQIVSVTNANEMNVQLTLLCREVAN